MATFTAGTTPVIIVRGRPFSLPLTWQTAAVTPAPIDLTPYSFAGKVTWSQNDGNQNTDGVTDLEITAPSPTSGVFIIALDQDSTLEIPDGANAVMGITLTDGAGATYDFAIPVQAATPVGV